MIREIVTVSYTHLKSLGNSPDPLELIDKYGADGVRMGMMLSAPAGNDILFDDALCEQGLSLIHI